MLSFKFLTQQVWRPCWRFWHHFSLAQAASIRHGPGDWFKGTFPCIKVDWKKVATRRFWQPRNWWPCLGSSGLGAQARAGQVGDESHQQLQMPRPVFTNPKSLTAAKLAPECLNVLALLEGDDRKEPEERYGLFPNTALKEARNITISSVF